MAQAACWSWIPNLGASWLFFGSWINFALHPWIWALFCALTTGGAGFGLTALGQPLRTAQLLQDFTGDKELLRRGVLRAVPGGNTALYDATVEAGRFLSDFRPTERFNRRLVVFTDGIDNESTRSINQATQELTTLARERGQKLTVYVVGLGVDLNLLELQRLAAATEGTFVLARFADQLS